MDGSSGYFFAVYRECFTAWFRGLVFLEIGRR